MQPFHGIISRKRIGLSPMVGLLIGATACGPDAQPSDVRVASGANVQPAVAAAPSTRYPACSDYTMGGNPTSTAGAAVFAEKSGAKYDVYSLNGYRKNQLGSGAWVGVVRRQDKHGGAAASIFPALPDSGDLGCLLFVRFRDRVGDTLSAAAYLLVAGQTDPYRLPMVAICQHTVDVPDGRPPHVKPNGGDCKDQEVLIMSIARDNAPPITSIVKLREDGSPEDLEGTLRKHDAFTRTVGDNELRAIVRRFGEPGPWFPCGTADCCRVF